MQRHGYRFGRERVSLSANGQFLALGRGHLLELYDLRGRRARRLFRKSASASWVGDVQVRNDGATVARWGAYGQSAEPRGLFVYDRRGRTRFSGGECTAFEMAIHQERVYLTCERGLARIEAGAWEPRSLPIDSTVRVMRPIGDHMLVRRDGGHVELFGAETTPAATLPAGAELAAHGHVAFSCESGQLERIDVATGERASWGRCDGGAPYPSPEGRFVGVPVMSDVHLYREDGAKLVLSVIRREGRSVVSVFNPATAAVEVLGDNSDGLVALRQAGPMLEARMQPARPEMMADGLLAAFFEGRPLPTGPSAR